MFLGYQNGKIVLAKDTREEIENAPCMTFDEIVETQEEYVLWGTDYILKADYEREKEAAEKQEQIEDLERQITARNIRGAILGDEYALNKVQEIEAQIAELRK